MMNPKFGIRKLVFILAAVTLAVTMVFNTGAAEARQKVVILHAGSLKVPLAEMEKRFENDFYSLATVKVTGKKSGSWIVRKGKSCTYGETLIKDSANPEGALLFLQYLLAADGGLEILKSMGQPPFTPCRVPNQQEFDMLPSELKNVVAVRQ